MAETTLKTRIKLLYKTYSEWEVIKNNFFPLKGELCIVSVPQTSGPDVVMMKVGQWDGVAGSASKKSYAELPFTFANAADVYAWAKKENLMWSDMTAEFKQGIIDLVGGEEKNTLYRIVEDGDSGLRWQLQKSEDNGTTWVDAVGTIDIQETVGYIEGLITAEAAVRQSADEALQADIDAEIIRAKAEEAKKVDKQIVGTNGTAEIFNEQDGGGAHFIHKDGSESFVGVNDGGKDGLMAQIYADMLEGGAWKGSRINVYHNGIFYVSKVNQAAGYARNAAEMEIATKKDIADLGQALHFVGIAEKQEGETELQAVERTFPAASQKAGAVAICGAKEFICCGTPLAWREFGDVSAYATKAELQAEATTRAQEDATLQANINAEAAARATEDAKKVDKEITSTAGKAFIFNEADGGGAKFENTDGVESFVGVNDGGASGIAAQIYADKLVDGKWQGAKLDVTNGGIYYTVGNKSAAERDVAANEVATKGNITDAVAAEATIRQTADTTLQTNIDIEAAARAAADAALESNKLNILPNVDDPTDPGYNWPYHIPYRFDVDMNATQANITLHTLTLDNKLTKMTFSKVIPSATQSVAGLMSAADKAKLDHFYAKDLQQETGDVLILDCNL